MLANESNIGRTNGGGKEKKRQEKERERERERERMEERIDECSTGALGLAEANCR